jgi:two-component system phosphate regulon sensor histidine kinase PhoR
VLISVSDQGPGIPPEEQERVFQRYYRAPGRRAEGLGLGLYLSREIVQLHGGQIWIESREGQGSTFMVLLPVERMQRSRTERMNRSFELSAEI